MSDKPFAQGNTNPLCDSKKQPIIKHITLMKTRQEKSKYERPEMQVFEIRHEGNLLTLSNPGDYTDGGDPMSTPSPELQEFFESDEF